MKHYSSLGQFHFDNFIISAARQNKSCYCDPFLINPDYAIEKMKRFEIIFVISTEGRNLAVNEID